MKHSYTIKFLSIFILLFITCICEAQPFAPVGAKWYYGVKQFEGGFKESYYTVEVIKDTIIFSDTFVKISDNQSAHYLLEENKRLFYWLNNKKYLLFDSSKEKGDTFNIDAFLKLQNRDTAIVTSVIVDSIIYVKANAINPNDSIKVFKLRHLNPLLGGNYNPGFFTDKLIKTVNYSNSFINIFNLPAQGGASSQFRCYQSPTYNYKDTSLGAKPCDYSYTGLSEWKKKLDFQIAPNPAHEYIFITGLSPAFHQLKILNNYGQILIKEYLNIDNTRVDIGALPKGIYHAILSTNNGEVYHRFIKE